MKWAGSIGEICKLIRVTSSPSAMVASVVSKVVVLYLVSGCSSQQGIRSQDSVALSSEKGTAFRMAREGDIAKLKQLKTAGIDVDQVNEIGVTPLMVACRYGQFKTAEWLIEQGAKADRLDQENQGPLHYALGSESTDEVLKPLVGLLIAKGADPFQTDKLGLVPVRVLIEENWIDQIRAVSFNVNPRKQCDRMVLRPGEMSYAKHARKLGHRELADYLDGIGCW